MLEHETETRSGAEAPAAQVRVTAEEFARAVARYQARREAAAQQMEGTVTLGEAVRELGLEATPEELWREVQAERAQQGQQTHPKAVRTYGAVGVTVGLLMIGLALGLCGLIVRPVPPASPPPVSIAQPAEPAWGQITALDGTLVLDKSLAKPQLDTLAHVPSERAVLCDLSATGDHIAFTNYSGSDVSWTLIKHGDTVYVRGWIADMSPAALRASTVTLYNVKSGVPAGIGPLPVTLRLDRLQCTPAQSNDEQITARNVTPDAHFTERW